MRSVGLVAHAFLNTQQQDLLAATRGEIALSLIQVYRLLGGGWQIRLAQDAYYDVPPFDAANVDAFPVEGLPLPERLATPEGTTD